MESSANPPAPAAVTPAPSTEGLDFIRTVVAEDLASNRYDGRVVTRFPPEPNGFLHIGHAKSICLNFGIAQEHPHGVCHLRFDDTNPTTEDMKFVAAMQEDIHWLGYDWGEHLYFASDYFPQLYQYAEELIQQGIAYVDSLSESEIREYRGTITEAGRPSPYRERSPVESLSLFHQMRAGGFEDGAHVLRAKIDMAAPNMKMRDPVLYRIRHAHHYRTGESWCIYPLYDFAHPLSDAIEGVTHSICTLEFENNREIYDWLLDHTQAPPRPHQYEFARLNLDYTIMSKRKLLQLVWGNHVQGWDDPRMPTLAGLRRRGVTASAIRAFCDQIGVAKANSRVGLEVLENCVRADLNPQVPRVMAVLRPLRVVITNYPAGQTEWLDASYYPHDVPKEGSRPVPFSQVIYIEQEDFREKPPKNYYRLAPGREVRLRYGYFITCTDVVKDAAGAIIELHCTYDPQTRGGDAADGRKVQGTLHWVSAAHSLPIDVRLYDRLFTVPNPEDTPEDRNFLDFLNPESNQVLSGARVEPSVATAEPGSRFQFERQGYFCLDPMDSTPTALVANRIVALRDSWAKQSQKVANGTERRSRPAASRQATKPVSAPPPAQEPAPLESPEVRRRLERYIDTLGLAEGDARILAGDDELATFFETGLTVHNNPKGLCNWILNELLRDLKERAIADLPFDGRQLAELVALVDGDTLSNTLAKDVLTVMLQEGGDPRAIVRRRGLEQVSDISALAPIVDRLLAAYPEKAAQFRSGKSGLLGFFMGQVMKETAGKANPQLVQELVKEKLGG